MARMLVGLLIVLLAMPASAAEPSDKPYTGPSAIDIGGYVSLAMGGALLAGAAAAAIFSLHKRIELEPVCQPRDDCPLAAAPHIDQMQLTAHIATGLSIGGFTSVGVGASLLLWPEQPEAHVAVRFPLTH